MRLYLGAVSPATLAKARQTNPNHVYGACWTPQKMTPHDVPYFIDNGAFTESFDHDEWLSLLDRIDEKMPYPPDFVVLPDEFNNAEATVARHRDYIYEVRNRGFLPAPVLQPGMAIETQVKIYNNLDVDTLFVGGEERWQRSHGTEIIETAHDHNLRVHVGNPGSAEAMQWWQKRGVDSMDTSSIAQSQAWHWLEKLDSGLSRGVVKKGGTQQSVTEWV